MELAAFKVADRDAGPALRRANQGGAGVVHLAVWGESDGDYVFSVNAETPETRKALVEAYQEAATAAFAEYVGVGAPDAEMLRIDFGVGDPWVESVGYVLDPEPDSHFTKLIGRIDSTIVSLIIFHREDDDRVTQAKDTATAIAERLD
ncbi:MAG: hypothetical protein U9N79_09430 [Actinomycetota bacterium]|nr:hypothetical protein [Actinomycetota bacterium]